MQVMIQEVNNPTKEIEFPILMEGTSCLVLMLGWATYGVTMTGVVLRGQM